LGVVRCGRICAVDLLCERSKSIAGALYGAAERDSCPVGVGRRALAHHPTVAERERLAVDIER